VREDACHDYVTDHLPVAAPLPLAGDAVSAAVHPHAGTVREEELGLLAGGHLRAVHAPVALIRAAPVRGDLLVEELRRHGVLAVDDPSV
jgi:hypothetical protein